MIPLALFAGSVLLAQDDIVDVTRWPMREGDDAQWASSDFDGSGWVVTVRRKG